MGSAAISNETVVDGRIRSKNYDQFLRIRFSKDKTQAVSTFILKRRNVDGFLQFLNDAKYEIVDAAGEYEVLDKLAIKGRFIKLRLNHDSSRKKIVWGRSVKSNLANSGPLLPPLEYPATTNHLMMKTVVLDLDETLIHTIKVTIGGDPPKTYNFLLEGDDTRVLYILKRPFVDEFLQCLSKNNFEIVLFTAGSEDYASQVLEFLDPNKSLFKHRLYRDSCYKVSHGNRIKDLSRLGRDLRKVVIVDDKLISYSLNPKNAIPIKPFIDNLQDDELMNLMGYFCQNRDEEFFKEFERTKDYRNSNDSWSEIQKIS